MWALTLTATRVSLLDLAKSVLRASLPGTVRIRRAKHGPGRRITSTGDDLPHVSGGRLSVGQGDHGGDGRWVGLSGFCRCGRAINPPPDTRKSILARVDIGVWCGYGFSRSPEDNRAWQR